MNIRALATQCLTEIFSNGRSFRELLPRFKKQCKRSEDAAFFQALVFGVMRWYPRLAFITNQLLKNPIQAKDLALFYLITVGLYQLREMRVPPHAAIAETVEAARILGKPHATGLINAILRSYQRQSESLEALIQSNPEAQYAHPNWMIDALKIAWPEHYADLLDANNTPPPLSLRINSRKTTQAEYLHHLEQTGIAATPIPNTTQGIGILNPCDVTALPGFEQGLFSVQDAAAQCAAGLLDLTPGLRVLDACAAPGGKTAHILETEPQLAALTAIDLAPKGIQQITENLHRLQLLNNTNTILQADAIQPSTWWDGKFFDRILLDAPCSATGVIRRHPDIKYLRRLNDIPKITLKQSQLLQALWPLLKPGGFLLYATCSVFPEENSMMIESFLNSQTDAQAIPFTIPWGVPQSMGHQLLSGQNNGDGFYYARIRKL
jgi:16S rRNA (cytosine967-C5)-methyltransferase